MTLQLQPGKWYRQRDGGKAYVAAELPEDVVMVDGEEFTFIGINRLGEMCSWQADGSYVLTAERREDLVAEWVDEPTDAEIAEAVRWFVKSRGDAEMEPKFCLCVCNSTRNFVDAACKYRSLERA